MDSFFPSFSALSHQNVRGLELDSTLVATLPKVYFEKSALFYTVFSSLCRNLKLKQRENEAARFHLLLIGILCARVRFANARASGK